MKCAGQRSHAIYRGDASSEKSTSGQLSVMPADGTNAAFSNHGTTALPLAALRQRYIADWDMSMRAASRDPVDPRQSALCLHAAGADIRALIGCSDVDPDCVKTRFCERRRE